MPTYQTPGVYVEEIATLPPSVAEVSTAIPAFIGYTETTGQPPTRISSMIEYKELFGGPPDAGFNVTVSDGAIKSIKRLEGKPTQETTQEPPPPPTLPLLYYSLRLYFDNGGGPCYIVSVGNYGKSPAPGLDDFKEGLDKLLKEDEPTLIVMPDAARLKPENYHPVCIAALNHCGTMKDRFAMLDLDVKDDVEAGAFRTALSSDYLRYGAVYAPFLKTALPYAYADEKVSVLNLPVRFSLSLDKVGLKIIYEGKDGDNPEVAIEMVGEADPDPDVPFSIDGNTLLLTIKTKAKKASGVVKAWKTWMGDHDSEGFQIEAVTPDKNAAATPQTPLKQEADFSILHSGLKITYHGFEGDQPKVVAQDGDGQKKIAINNPRLVLTIKNVKTKTAGDVQDAWKTVTKKAGFDILTLDASTMMSKTSPNQLPLPPSPPKLDTIRKGNTALYNQIKTALSRERVTLPPSGAMAGIYARVDRERGVWKAPANVAVASVIALTKTITDQDQERLNIDPTGGKSINAIRSFTGRGTLVWGARTLAGNDNEWRYVSVRRLFIMIEESTRKSTAFAVFEPNDATTWLKVRAMVESYLYGLWQQGALAGPTPESAYYVHVGLGTTMTTQDILEGRMIVEIGIAAVRPAEFIILRFSHKLQEA